jgi:hypothetical protein
MVSTNIILEAIQDGIIEAQKSYKKAASSPLCWAPKYLINVNVYQSLFKNTGRDSLTLENDKKSLEKMKAIKPKRKKIINKVIDRCDNPRIDIILWEPDQGTVVAFMETKKNARSCMKDVERICSSMEQGGKFGVLISTIHQQYKPNPNITTGQLKAKRILTKRLELITDDIQQRVKTKTRFEARLFKKKHEIYSVDTNDGDKTSWYWVWRPVIFVIERK